MRFRVVVFSWLFFTAASSVDAADRFALVITGASGGAQYAQKYDQWRTDFVAVLENRLGYPQDRVVVLAETQSAGVQRATRENVRAAVAALARRITKDDVLLVVLIGHGTADGDSARFNLVGPDLSADDWADLVKPIAGRLIFVDTTSGSFPFLQKLAGRGRIVLTATDTAAQQFETIFPEFFVKAFDDLAADLDKNDRTSIWEAFEYASEGVRNWFEERGRLATERPLLDDTGDGIGREARAASGPDGAVAQATYLQDPTAPTSGNPEVGNLLRRRAEIQKAIELLRARQPVLTPEQYDAELEKLLLELARVDGEIRAKT
jgi:hypothetical protein